MDIAWAAILHMMKILHIQGYPSKILKNIVSDICMKAPGLKPFVASDTVLTETTLATLKK